MQRREFLAGVAAVGATALVPDILQGAQTRPAAATPAFRIDVHYHGNSPGFIAAIKAQLDELPFCTRRYTNLPAIRLAKKLAELGPGNLKKVLFAPGGTSAIGMGRRPRVGVRIASWSSSRRWRGRAAAIPFVSASKTSRTPSARPWAISSAAAGP